MAKVPLLIRIDSEKNSIRWLSNLKAYAINKAETLYQLDVLIFIFGSLNFTKEKLSIAEQLSKVYSD